MPTPTYTPLANTTLGSSASSVTFSSISGSYRDLILVFNGSASADENLRFKLNASTSGYRAIEATGSGSTTAKSTEPATGAGYITINYPSVGSGRTVGIYQFMDYSATDKHKSVLIRNNSSDWGTAMTAARWANTAAVTSIQLYPNAGTFSAGSTFELFGIAS
jgi:hypothetical protein